MDAKQKGAHLAAALATRSSATARTVLVLI
jgi:hypothetical protein